MTFPSPYLSLRGIIKTYRDGKNEVAALRDIDLDIGEGKVLGIVGESGCGKSTLGRIAALMEAPSCGEVYVRGLPIKSLEQSVKRRLRRMMQMVFQDPYSSLNPLMTIEDCIGEGIDIHRIAFGKERKERIAALLDAVGLDPAVMEKCPHEFSGGQRQRIVIARALAVEPEFLVCDEPLAALDVCTQKHILELLIKQKRERRLTCLFISHDIGAVGAIADTIAVMYLGTIVEVGPAAELIAHPRHPYTKALIGSIPVADPAIERGRKKIVLVGDPPSPLHPPSGCPFHPRCSIATDLCKKERPKLSNNHCACHHPQT